MGLASIVGTAVGARPEVGTPVGLSSVVVGTAVGLHSAVGTAVGLASIVGGNANERFFAGLAGAAALVFDEEIEWTIVEVCDMVEEAEIVLVLRERWENKGTESCK